MDGVAARGLVNGRGPLRRSGRDEVGTLVPTNQAKLTLSPLLSYINQKKEMTFWSSPFLIEYILESSLDLFDCVGLDYVADLDVVVALDVKTAVHTHVNLLDIILESLE